MSRKIIQLSADAGYDGVDKSKTGGVYALCDDGSVFYLHGDSDTWEPLPPIPQEEEKSES